jgi:hypothetical protein
MSATVPVSFRGGDFWAFDVGLGIFLKHLLDAARKRAGGENAPWLDDCIQRWRVNRAEIGLHLDEKWSDDQRRTVLDLIEEACTVLKEKKVISAEERDSWSDLNGLGVLSRGRSPFPTGPVIELGEAVKALLVGALPAAPEGTWWAYGWPRGRTTIAMHPYPE